MAQRKQMAVAAMPNPAEAMKKALNGYEDLIALGKDNLKALAQANAAAMAGAGQINAELAAYARDAQEANLAAAKVLTGAKNVQELVELQAGHVQATLDAALAKGTQVTELAVAVANDVAEPLQARAKVAVEKVMAPLAV